MAEKVQSAPGELELVRQFVNTNDFDEGTELLTTPAKLGEWLGEHGLGVDRLYDADLEQAIDLREALRALLANAGAPLDRDAVEQLNDVAGRIRLLVRFDDSGNSTLDSGEGRCRMCPGRDSRDSPPLDGGRHLAPTQGLPGRHLCGAFYDTSKNRSAHWCSMAVCGNRAKARAYRQRHSKRAGRGA